MRIDCEWYDDIERHVQLTSGSKEALEALVYYCGVPHLKDDDLHIHSSNRAFLLCKKTSWDSLDSVSQRHIKSYCMGFSDGFTYLEERDRK